MAFITADNVRRWPNNRVPYVIGAEFPPGSVGRVNIDAAIATWNATGAISLVPRVGGDADYLAFKSTGLWCRSGVGRAGGEQTIDCALQNPGWNAGSVMHEIGHAIGLFHEHQRPDRNQFVKVEAAVVNSVNYKIEPGVPLGAYDCGSIMHYRNMPNEVTHQVPECLAAVQANALSCRDVGAARWMNGFRVRAFRGADANTVFVLGTDGRLWREQNLFVPSAPTRLEVDRGVSAFQPLGPDRAFVLGADGNLWFEQAPFGNPPPPRVLVDKSVFRFQALDANTVYILGADGNLWLAQGPFGNPPPNRVLVDKTVAMFQAVSANSVFIRGVDANLWLAQGPFGNPPPARVLVDKTVGAFTAVDANTVYVLGADKNLWRAHAPFGNPPPGRVRIDGSVAAFQPVGPDVVFVRGGDRNLWRVSAPFGAVPHPARVFVAGNVDEFHAFDAQRVHLVDPNRVLWQRFVQ